MLTLYLDQKAVPQHGPRLLPRLIVRSHRKLVEGNPLPGQHQSRSPLADQRSALRIIIVCVYPEEILFLFSTGSFPVPAPGFFSPAFYGRPADRSFFSQTF